MFFQLRLPAGTAFGATLESVKKAEALIKDDQDISTYTAYVGQGSPRFWLGLNPQLPNESFAEIVIVSKDVEARERIKARIEKAVADGALSEARVRVDRFNFGPPVGFPVQFRVIGPDTKKVRDIAYRVREVMRANNQVIDPHLDWNEQAPYLKLVVDQDRVRALGMTPQDISKSLSMLISGVKITTVRDGIEKVEVVARAVPVRAARSCPYRRPVALFAQRRRGSAVADRKGRICPRGADPLAHQSRHGDHRPRRRRRRRSAAGRDQRDLAEASIDPRQP